MLSSSSETAPPPETPAANSWIHDISGMWHFIMCLMTRGIPGSVQGRRSRVRGDMLQRQTTQDDNLTIWFSASLTYAYFPSHYDNDYDNDVMTAFPAEFRSWGRIPQNYEKQNYVTLTDSQLLEKKAYFRRICVIRTVLISSYLADGHLVNILLLQSHLTLFCVSLCIILCLAI